MREEVGAQPACPAKLQPCHLTASWLLYCAQPRAVRNTAFRLTAQQVYERVLATSFIGIGRELDQRTVLASYGNSWTRRIAWKLSLMSLSTSVVPT